MVNEWDRRFAKKGAIWGAEPSLGAKFAADYFTKCGAQKVLDVASGYGRDSIFLAKNFEVTGVDLSTEGLRMANEKALREKVAARFVLGDVRMMPFTPDSFDAVLCNGILAHLLPEERQMLAREIERVLHRGGALVISEFSIERKPEGAVKIDAEQAGEEDTFREHDKMVHHYFESGELQVLFPSIEFEHIGMQEEPRSDGREARLKWVLAGRKK